MVASIEDLPRLNDEERDARDDHAAIAGVPSNDPTEKRSRNRHPWRSAFFARWRLRRLQRSIARAEQYLAARQDANEKYGVYDQPVRDAEQELARLQKEVASPPRLPPMFLKRPNRVLRAPGRPKQSR